jgi:phage shock protein C
MPDERYREPMRERERHAEREHYPAPQRREDYHRDERPYLTEQPASRTRFYRDKRNGKLFGVCAGIADYTGFDVNLVRVCFLATVFMSGGSVLPFYFIAAMVTPTKPRALEFENREDREFWQGVRASPARTARDIRSRLRDIDRRLADIESYVTSENRTLAREIEQLR